MDIVCPNCAAAYRVPDSLLAGGKPLRCAACGQDWVPGAAPAAPAQPAPPVPEAADPAPQVAPREVTERPPLVIHDPRPPVSERARRMERPLALSWLASISGVAIALAAMAVYRHEIAVAWPPFGRIVALLGG